MSGVSREAGRNILGYADNRMQGCGPGDGQENGPRLRTTRPPQDEAGDVAPPLSLHDAIERLAALRETLGEQADRDGATLELLAGPHLTMAEPDDVNGKAPAGQVGALHALLSDCERLLRQRDRMIAAIQRALVRP